MMRDPRDGRVLYDRYLMWVKSPAESQYTWGYLTVVAKVRPQRRSAHRARADAR
ncbi:MAG TPA: hypothetical protein VFE60_20720 [Roseiarcus sp.]|jgi:hypothetical protein|nr:hypothetical protein [Roseiarcus sp.]